MILYLRFLRLSKFYKFENLCSLNPFPVKVISFEFNCVNSVSYDELFATFEKYCENSNFSEISIEYLKKYQCFYVN